MQANTPVGIIGLGLVGTALCERLLLRAAIAIAGPDSDSAAVSAAIQQRPDITGVAR
jgi:predicted dinucleotide-binding enzyme